jgi:putative ABC transport system permease protein
VCSTTVEVEPKKVCLRNWRFLTYGACAVDPATFLGVLAVLTTVVLAASFIPVRRATRVEPTVALRNE